MMPERSRKGPLRRVGERRRKARHDRRFAGGEAQPFQASRSVLRLAASCIVLGMAWRHAPPPARAVGWVVAMMVISGLVGTAHFLHVPLPLDEVPGWLVHP